MNISTPYVFGTLGSLSCGYLADGLFRRGVSAVNSRKFPIGIGLLGSAGFTIPVAHAPDANMAVIYLCGVMFFLYLASTGAWALANVVTPRHTVATVGAMQNFGGYFGGSFAPVITGRLLEHTQSFKGRIANERVGRVHGCLALLRVGPKADPDALGLLLAVSPNPRLVIKK